MDFLKGKKTHILSVLAGLATVAFSLGFIDGAMYTTAMGILAPGALMALRAGVEKNK